MATAPKAANKSLKAVPSPNAEGAPAGSNKKLILIIALVVVLVLAGGIGGAWFYFNSKQQHDGHASAKRVNRVPVFLSMESFTVNLQVEEMPQYLQVAMTLQAADDATADLMRQNMPQVRNRLLLLLSSKKASELLSVDGKKKLASEIIEQLKKPFSPQGSSPEVLEVFFTSFVIQ